MGFTEGISRSIDFGVAKGSELALNAVKGSAEVAVIANVLGIGLTAATLTRIVARHIPEVVAATGYIAGKLVR